MRRAKYVTRQVIWRAGVDLAGGEGFIYTSELLGLS